MKYFTEIINEDQLIQHIECGPSSNSRLETFIGSLFGIIVDVPLRDFTYAVHLEAVISLIVLLSVQLQSSKRADQSTIYRLIVKGRHAIHAPLLVKSLLSNFMEQKRAPPTYGGNSSHNSIVFGKLRYYS